MDSIFELEDYVNELKKEDTRSYKLFKEIYSYYSEVGTMDITPSMKMFVLNNFGKRDESGSIIEGVKEVFNRLEKQRIINIFNEWTCQGNSLQPPKVKTTRYES